MADGLRYGLIGCGGIARGHMAAYSHLFEMVACCDIYEPAAHEFQGRFGFSRTYTDVRAMLENERLDFVTVCTSTTHDRLDIVLACAATGTHVLVEKPMALTRGQARRMVAACADAGVKLAVSQQYRNFPHVKAARTTCCVPAPSGKPFLGELRMAHLGWFPLKGAKRSDYFVKFDKVLLLNGTVHHFDMLRYLLAAEPQRIYTRAGQAPFRTAIGERGDTWSVSTVDFPGCTFQVFNSSDCHGGAVQWDGWMHVECERGSLYLNPDADTPLKAYSADLKSWIWCRSCRPAIEFRTAAWQSHGAPVHGVDRRRCRSIRPAGATTSSTLALVFAAYDSDRPGGLPSRWARCETALLVHERSRAHRLRRPEFRRCATGRSVAAGSSGVLDLLDEGRAGA